MDCIYYYQFFFTTLVILQQKLKKKKRLMKSCWKTLRQIENKFRFKSRQEEGKREIELEF